KRDLALPARGEPKPWAIGARPPRSESHAELPGNELEISEPVRFAGALPAACRMKDQLENFPAALRQRLRTAQYRAAVVVDVLAHASRRVAVRGDLDAGRRLGPENGAASGGKADHVRAGGNLACDRAGVVAGAVHE